MTEQWQKDILKIPVSRKSDIIAAIELIVAGDVVNLDIKKLKNTTLSRCRIGNYRIIFEQRGKDIIIKRIGNRGDIYKKI